MAYTKLFPVPLLGQSSSQGLAYAFLFPGDPQVCISIFGRDFLFSDCRRQYRWSPLVLLRPTSRRNPKGARVSPWQMYPTAAYVENIPQLDHLNQTLYHLSQEQKCGWESASPCHPAPPSISSGVLGSGHSTHIAADNSQSGGREIREAKGGISRKGPTSQIRIEQNLADSHCYQSSYLI